MDKEVCFQTYNDAEREPKKNLGETDIQLQHN